MNNDGLGNRYPFQQEKNSSTLTLPRACTKVPEAKMSDPTRKHIRVNLAKYRQLAKSLSNDERIAKLLLRLFNLRLGTGTELGSFRVETERDRLSFHRSVVRNNGTMGERRRLVSTDNRVDSAVGRLVSLRN